MFNCGACGKTTKAGEAANHRVVATRPKTYRNVIKLKPRIDEETGEERPPARGRRDARPQYVESHGQEIVKEIITCNACAEKATAPTE